MRKKQKEAVLEFIGSLYEAHKEIDTALKSGKAAEARSMICDCQECAIELGNIIEASEGEGAVTVSYIERYCELLYHSYEKLNTTMSAELNNNHKLFTKITADLNTKLSNIESSIRNDIRIKIEIAFFPYKASMWDSLESIYLAAKEDEDCDAYCVPIPYYDKNPDGSFGKMHYEGREYPKDIEVIDWRAYDFRERKPDIIYIHNPYDDGNYVSSVDPLFYSEELKKYTDCLVYVPYFVMDEKTSSEKARIYALTKGAMNANKVIVQSENVRKAYIDAWIEYVGESPTMRNMLENKILGIGSPKFDSVLTHTKEMYDIPEDWKEIIGDKKVILYDTHLSLLMKRSYKRFLPKLRDVIELFRKRTDVILLWRPHPLMISTAKVMNSTALREYLEIVDYFRSGGWGIYDDTTDMGRAIALSDAYYGSNSSILILYRMTGKPILIHNIDVRTENL